MKKSILKDFLDEQVDQYNNLSFVTNDPIQIPHQFTDRQDIEISALIIATIAWGNRKSIINNGNKLIEIMGDQPFDFIQNASEEDLRDLRFVHRTFQTDDLKWFISFLKDHYQQSASLQSAFKGENVKDRIIHFRKAMLHHKHEKRSEKHIANPESGSSAKRLNMFLRWMVRSDNRGVDFGIWKDINTAELMVPLDVHTGNTARKLELISRNANDWKALEELMGHLREFDPNDPAKYDFALFGIGVDNLL